MHKTYVVKFYKIIINKNESLQILGL